MTSDRIRQQTIVEQVMSEIRDLIASNAYSAGDKIPTEKELAERFGVGRSSIREAIKIFNYLGVLESRAALGTFIRDRSQISSEAFSLFVLLGNDELDDLIELRGAVELWSVVRLVTRIRNGDPAAGECIQSLRAIVEEMHESAAGDEREPLIEADFGFHYEIIKSSGNPLLVSVYDTLRSFLHEEIRRSQNDYEDPLQIYEEHRELVESMESGELSVALAAYTDHIENIKQRVRN